MLQKLVTVVGGALVGAFGYRMIEGDTAAKPQNAMRLAWLTLGALPFLTIRGVPAPIRFGLTTITAIGAFRIVTFAEARAKADAKGGVLGGIKSAWSLAFGGN